MSTVEPAAAGLNPGQRMSREEFLRRWEALPGLKRAELIRGVVYMPSPLSLEHAALESLLSGWMVVYAARTPGCQVLTNATWLMTADDAPQPDVSLRLLAGWGGQSRQEGIYAAGAPELAAEVCVTSTAHDLGEKLELYQQAGVREYLAVLIGEREIRWHQRAGERYVVAPRPRDGVFRSAVFPGLWLDADGLMANDAGRVLETLHQGLTSAEHGDFLARLAARRPS